MKFPEHLLQTLLEMYVNNSTVQVVGLEMKSLTNAGFNPFIVAVSLRG
jgi:hypothetical protein